MEKVDDLEKKAITKTTGTWSKNSAEDKMSLKLFKVHPIILSHNLNLNQP